MQPGTVYLVGAGPGDPGLLTLRGQECLQRADLVLYDGLVNPLLLLHTHARAERTCRGESRATRSLKQQEINHRLIDAALAGQTVVRLKGGDPFVFGRGSEEARALADAGIPFEVVPGVTAAVAAGAYAGFSLTHREHASAVAFVTGHEDPAKSDLVVDYAALARFPGSLVFYMGLNRLGEISAALIAAGKPPTTPAAVISRATTPEQRTVTATLETIARESQNAGLHAPSLFIVGECVLQRETIAWYEHQPLFGIRIGIARAASQCTELIPRFAELGAQPVLMPTIEILPPEDWTAVDAAIDRLARFDWIVFTSSNGVSSLLGRMWERGLDARRLGAARLAAIGEGTAQSLADFHLRADLVPETFRAEALAAALVPHVVGKNVLWARASRGRDVLPTELRRAGANLEEVVVYRNVDITEWPADTQKLVSAGSIDWICLSSPSIARGIARLLPASARAELGQRLRLASISPVTTAAAVEAGLPVSAEAVVHTWEGLLEAVMQASAH